MAQFTNPTGNQLKITKGWKFSTFPKIKNYGDNINLLKLYLFLKSFLHYKRIKLISCQLNIIDPNTKILSIMIHKFYARKFKHTISTAPKFLNKLLDITKKECVPYIYNTFYFFIKNNLNWSKLLLNTNFFFKSWLFRIFPFFLKKKTKKLLRCLLLFSRIRKNYLKYNPSSTHNFYYIICSILKYKIHKISYQTKYNLQSLFLIGNFYKYSKNLHNIVHKNLINLKKIIGKTIKIKTTNKTFKYQKFCTKNNNTYLYFRFKKKKSFLTNNNIKYFFLNNYMFTNNKFKKYYAFLNLKCLLNQKNKFFYSKRLLLNFIQFYFNYNKQIKRFFFKKYVKKITFIIKKLTKRTKKIAIKYTLSYNILIKKDNVLSRPHFYTKKKKFKFFPHSVKFLFFLKKYNYLLKIQKFKKKKTIFNFSLKWKSKNKKVKTKIISNKTKNLKKNVSQYKYSFKRNAIFKVKKWIRRIITHKTKKLVTQYYKFKHKAFYYKVMNFQIINNIKYYIEFFVYSFFKIIPIIKLILPLSQHKTLGFFREIYPLYVRKKFVFYNNIQYKFISNHNQIYILNNILFKINILNLKQRNKARKYYLPFYSIDKKPYTQTQGKKAKINLQKRKVKHLQYKAMFRRFIPLMSIWANIFDPIVLADQIAHELQKTKNHRDLIYNIKFMVSLAPNNTIFARICKIGIYGKINSSRRTKVRYITNGVIGPQTYTNNIKYALSHARARTGTFGVKVWLSN